MASIIANVIINKLIGPHNMYFVDYITCQDTYYGLLYQLCLDNFENWNESKYYIYILSCMDMKYPLEKRMGSFFYIVNTPDEYMLYLENIWKAVKKQEYIDDIDVSIGSNDDYQIIEGHHRMTFYIANNMKHVRCRIYDSPQQYIDELNKI